ncbi:MAG: sel1 repeat family protein [gamma proteobacterium symbiont of Phacoides pectinatus]
MHPTPTLAALLLLLLLPSQAPAVEPSPVTEGYRAYRDQQWELAHSLWLPEAQRGDPRAQFYLSRLYSEGLGAMASRQEAFEWLSRSAQSGFAPAQYSLGNLHKNGHWVNTDRQIASEWYALAAEQGHRQAQYELALLLLERGDPGNMETGINWLKRAAIRGDTAATRLLGELDIDPRAPRTKLSPEGMAKIGILISSRTASPEQNDTRRADTRTAPLGSTQQRDRGTAPQNLRISLSPAPPRRPARQMVWTHPPIT